MSLHYFPGLLDLESWFAVLFDIFQACMQKDNVIFIHGAKAISTTSKRNNLISILQELKTANEMYTHTHNIRVCVVLQINKLYVL